MPLSENEISFIIRGAAFKVYSNLGPGLLESVYEKALAYELETLHLQVHCQKGIPMVYQGIPFDIGFRMDLEVEGKVVVEIKSVEKLTDVHHKQLLTYIRLANKKLGLLINFNTIDLKTSIIRIVNNL